MSDTTDPAAKNDNLAKFMAVAAKAKAEREGTNVTDNPDTFRDLRAKNWVYVIQIFDIDQGETFPTPETEMSEPTLVSTLPAAFDAIAADILEAFPDVNPEGQAAAIKGKMAGYRVSLSNTRGNTCLRIRFNSENKRWLARVHCDKVERWTPPTPIPLS